RITSSSTRSRGGGYRVVEPNPEGKINSEPAFPAFLPRNLPPGGRETVAQRAGEGRGGPAPRAGPEDYADAWKEADRENKLIFIDFAAITDTNGRDNELNVLPKPEVSEQLKKYARVRLYTDRVPDPRLSAENARRQADRHREWRDSL